MKKLVLKNSLLIAVLALLTIFFVLPTQAHADIGDVEYQVEVNTGIIAGAQLNGYQYSFSKNPADYDGAESSSNLVYVYGYAQARQLEDVAVELDEFLTESTPERSTYDFTGIWELDEFKDATIVCIVVEFVLNGKSYKDMIVYNKIAASETVDTAAEQDTTFTYDVESVVTANLDDLDLERAIINNRDWDDGRIEYYLEYLRDKDDILSADKDYTKGDIFQWVNNQLVLKKGEKSVSGNLVFALLTSELFKAAGYEAGHYYDKLIFYQDPKSLEEGDGAEWVRAINLVNLVPLAFNIKEVAIDKQYTVSDQIFGYTYKLAADILSGELFELDNLLGYVEIFFKGGEFQWGRINFGKCFSLMQFQNGYTPAKFVEGFNRMFHDLVIAAIEDVNLVFALDLQVQLLLLDKNLGLVDEADAVAWLYDHFSASELESTTDTLLVAALMFVPQAIIRFATFVAEAAPQLETAKELTAAFEHKAVNTSDANNFMLYVAMMMLALVGAAGVALKRN